MNILVTGGLGFIGSHLVDQLVLDGHKVDVIDDLSTGCESNQNSNTFLNIGTSEEWCRSHGDKFHLYDIIFHFANNARIARSFEYCRETMLNNYVSTVEMCDAIKRSGSKARLIFASSSTTEHVDRFNNPYTFSKTACDEILELYRIHFGLQYDIVKFYNVYGSDREQLLGEYTTVIRKYKNQYIKGLPLTVYGTGHQRRDFTHIDDTISALRIIMDEPAQGKTYHIGTTKTVSINEIVNMFGSRIDHQPARHYEAQVITCREANVPNWEGQQRLLQHIREWLQINGD